MLLSYVRFDLLRNPRRTLASLAGVTLGVGLFSSVLFFIDSSEATMTTRAVASLALDMQAVLASPLDGGLTLKERLVAPHSLEAGDEARVILSVINKGPEPANEVVINDEPPSPLTYVQGTTTVDGKSVPDKGGRSPLAQGLARSGLNIGTVPPRTTVKLTYVARAARWVERLGSLRLRGTVSSRENVVPARANPPPQATLEQLEQRINRIPGVAAADELSFVDLPPGSLQAGAQPDVEVRKSRTGIGRVRVFAFDRGYPRHYPSIRIVAGSLAPGSAMISAEASRALAATPGEIIRLNLPGRPDPLSLPISGVVDLGRAKPLFYSRKTNKFEDFLYVANTVIVTPATFENAIVPAFRAARAKRGSLVKSLPVQELDVLVDRSRLQSDPASALVQTRSIAQSIEHVAADQGYLVDNISNALHVARDDASVGKRMFLFLGLPGALLAGVLSAYAGSILATTQRREQAILRVRGAHLGHLRTMLAYKTLALAGVGSVLGTGLGLLSVVFVLPRGTLQAVPVGDLVVSGIIAAAMGILTTAAALYIPGRRSLQRDVTEERAEIAVERVPAWRRWRLDFALLAAAAIAEAAAFAAGAFDPPTASVSAGQAVAFPARLLPAPLIAWFGGVLFSARIFAAVMSRLRLPSRPRFGPSVTGTLRRSLRRRAWPSAAGIVGVGLVVALGVGLALFTATYNAAKSADSRFVVGADLRVTPSVVSPRRHPPEFSSRLEVAGVSAVSPVMSNLENAVLIGPDNQDRADLAAIDPESFRRVAGLSDAFFVDRSAEGAMAALAAHPRGLFVDATTADDFGISTGDRVQVLLDRGTNHQTLKTFRVVGLFVNFPGFPQHTNLVANLDYYEAATGLQRADFFLARVTDGSRAGLTRATAAIRSGPGKKDAFNIDSTETALDKDQSSLTALNIHGLATLGWLYTLVMSAATIGIFVFGLMLQRRKEYATLRAQGMQTAEVRALVFGETALVAISGVAVGIFVGSGVAYLLIHILRPLFILDPGMAFASEPIAAATVVALAATSASALGAIAILQHVRPSELLRDA